MVVLASGTGTLAEALMEAADRPKSPFRIAALITDRDCAALERAENHGVTGVVIPPRDHADRATWDRALADTIAGFEPEWVVTAGFMRILGADFVERFAGRAINSHPALLPAFPGAHGVRDALEYGVKVTGCTVHLIDAGVDTGPVIAQAVVEIADDDTEASLHERIKTHERQLLVDVLGAAARGTLRTEGRKVIRS